MPIIFFTLVKKYIKEMKESRKEARQKEEMSDRRKRLRGEERRREGEIVQRVGGGQTQRREQREWGRQSGVRQNERS